MHFLYQQNQKVKPSYPPRSDPRLTALDTTAPAESSDRYEDVAEETDQSTSLRSSKRGRPDDDEATSKHTSSGDLIMEEGHSKEVLNVSPISSRPPPAKKVRNDAWDIEVLDDDDSE